MDLNGVSNFQQFILSPGSVEDCIKDPSSREQLSTVHHREELAESEREFGDQLLTIALIILVKKQFWLPAVFFYVS